MKSVIRKGGVQKSKISSAALLHIISTVRLRKALRVMCYACFLGAKPFPGLSPRQGRPKTEISHQRTNFRKSLVFKPDSATRFSHRKQIFLDFGLGLPDPPRSDLIFDRVKIKIHRQDREKSSKNVSKTEVHV